MQTTLMSLWLPILVSAVALFFASWIAWMFLPHHNGEWQGLPKEDATMDVLRSVPPGQYMFPFGGKGEGNTEAFQKRVAAGPNGTVTIWRGPHNMTRSLVYTFLFFLATSFLIAYLAGMAIPPAAPFRPVFRFVSTAGILTYGTANILNGIWFHRKMIADIADGIAYGLITGLLFAALWPPGQV